EPGDGDSAGRRRQRAVPGDVRQGATGEKALQFPSRFIQRDQRVPIGRRQKLEQQVLKVFAAVVDVGISVLRPSQINRTNLIVQPLKTATLFFQRAAQIIWNRGRLKSRFKRIRLWMLLLRIGLMKAR